MNKGTGLSIFAAILLFGVFSVFVFLLPIPKAPIFWLGYSFLFFALLTVTAALGIYSSKRAKEDRFLAVPSLKAAWTYFILQAVLSCWEIFAFTLPFLAAVGINLGLGVVFAILIPLLSASAQRIDKAEQQTAEKVLFIKRLKMMVDAIQATDLTLRGRLRTLSENIRFSDPLSHSNLRDIEGELMQTIGLLAQNAKDPAAAEPLLNEAERLLQSRNALCKSLKGIKDPNATPKSTGGGKLILGACGGMMVLILTVLTICFLVIPQTQYDDALALVKAGKYEEAVAAFEKLGNFQDSEEQIQEIDLLQKETLYLTAEAHFDSGRLAEALPLYISLGDYKEATARTVEIHNRLAKGNTIYFGTMEGKPLAWKVIKKEKDRLLLLSENPVKALPYHRELEKIAYEDSTLKEWLNNEFLAFFSEEEQVKLLPDEKGESIFLLDKATAKSLLKKKGSLKADTDWWIADSKGINALFITAKGKINEKGDMVTKEKGIRPALWLDIE